MTGRRIAQAAVALLGLLALAAWRAPRPGGPALGTVVVGVAELGSGAPILDAEVRFPELRLHKRTDWMGEVRFDDVPAGTWHVWVRKVGYAPADAQIAVGRKTVGPVFMLERLPSTTLDTVRVREHATPMDVDLARFDARRRMGIGRFVTDSMFRAERTNDLATVLSTRLTGLDVGTDNAGHLTFNARRAAAGHGCLVEVYLDDVLLWPDATTRAGLRGRPPINDFPALTPNDLAGAEFYAAYSAPVQYRPPGRGCAVLLLWSRRD